MLIYRNNWFPRPQLNSIKEHFYPPIEIPIQKPKELRICFYEKGVPLFSDRNYIDTIGNEQLNKSFVLQIPRHYHSNIDLKINQDIIIYRLLSETDEYNTLGEWKKTPIKVFVAGQSCIHTYVVSKNFSPSTILIHSEGEISSSPILIKPVNSSNCLPFSIIK